MDLDAETALAPTAEEGVWSGRLAPGWETPRGPLGGYVMAIVLRGLALQVGDPDRHPRSVTMHFLRVPEPGDVIVRTTLEREGRSLSTVTGRLEQEGRLLGIAIGASSRPWESPLLDDAPMPEAEPPEGRRPPQEDLPDAKTPEFLRRLTLQHRFGDPPFSRSAHGEVGGWLGLREERPLDALAVALLADAWFPAAWPRLSALAPAPTIDLTLHFRTPLPLPDGLLLGRFRSRLVRDGFFEEDGELWAQDGTLIAQSRQLALLIGAQA